MVAFSVGYVRYGSAYMRLWPVARGKATVCRAELTVCRVQCQMFVIVIYWALQLAATCAIARAGAWLRVNVNVKSKSNVKRLTLTTSLSPGGIPPPFLSILVYTYIFFF